MRTTGNDLRHQGTETRNLVIVTDCLKASKAIAGYLKETGEPESETFFLVYGSRGLRPELLSAAALMILGLSRRYGYRVRAEGVMVASSLAKHNKPFLVVSGHTEGKRVQRPTYWDLESEDTLISRVAQVLSSPLDWRLEAAELRRSFEEACFEPPDSHHYA